MTEHTVKVKSGDTVLFQEDKKNEDKNRFKRRFDSFGRKSTDSSEDFTDLLLQLNLTEIKLLALLMKNRDFRTNESVLIKKELDQSQRTIVDRGYKGLAKANVVIRTRSETYLFNPRYLIADKDAERNVWNRWNELKRRSSLI